MRVAIGIDVGGTNLRAALVNEEGVILKKIAEETATFKTVSPFFEKLIVIIKEVAGDQLENLIGIGLGLPGICNSKEGIVYQSPHYPEWRDVKAVAILQKEFSCPIFLDNDANFAALGEYWKGAAKSLKNFILLTLGTGIGGGLFLDGKIWHGDKGFAGEVGHMTIEANGRPCACGKKGCWETYAASQAVPNVKTASGLALAAAGGDKEALKFWEEFGRYLGIGIANLANITGVGNYILGGGIANASEYFLKPCRKEICKTTKIIPSTLSGDGNLLGAVYDCFNR